MRRILVLLTLAAVIVGGLAVRDVVTRPAYDFDGIHFCTRPEVVPAPDVTEVDLSETVRLELVADVEVVTSFVPWVDTSSMLATKRTGEVVLVDLETSEVTELLDLSDEVVLDVEGGLLAAVVSPADDAVFMHLTDEDGTSRIVGYRIEDGEIDPSSRREILSEPHDERVHNGGSMMFGADGYLYLAFGDGGHHVEHAERADDLDNLGGKILRIDPQMDGGEPYLVPADNPFPDAERPEIWALGFRNPWQFTIDETTGDLWVGDVGTNCYEEVSVAPDRGRGAYFGHPDFEANYGLLSDTVDDADRPPVFPVITYTQAEGGCAVIGGRVYRGTELPELRGAYLYSGFCLGGVRWVRPGDGVLTGGDLDLDIQAIQAFGEGRDGELYALSVVGVFELVAPAGGPSEPTP